MKKFLALILVLSMLFLTTACSGLGDILNVVGNIKDLSDDWEKYEEARKDLKNYKIVVETTNYSGEKEIVTEMRTEQGYAYIAKDYIIYMDYDSGSNYWLNSNDKTGYISNYDVSEYQNFGVVLTGYSLLFNVARIAAKKDGTDKIAGRKTTCYAYTENDNTQKFWLDDEYGIVMKYTSTSSGSLDQLEVTEFKKGGVKLSDSVNLKDYEIRDIG